MGKINREDVLNLPLEFETNNKHDAEVIKTVLQAVMDYVRNLPPADEPVKRPATRRKKS